MTKPTSTDTWKWLLGLFVTCSLGLSSVVYAAVTARITDLENDRRSTAMLFGQVNVQLELLKDHSQRLEGLLQSVVETQSLSSKKLDMLILSDQQARQWRDVAGDRARADSQRWNRLIDEQPKVGAKK